MKDDYMDDDEDKNSKRMNKKIKGNYDHHLNK